MSYKDVLIGHIRYNEEYSGTDWTQKIGDFKAMYRDRGLFMTERQIINSPQPDTNLIKIPGSSNIIDLSEALTGFPTYGTRLIKMVFAVSDLPYRFPLRYDEAVNDFHGRRFDIIFEDDPGYFYSGRVTINALESDKNAGKITFEAECEPYKKEITQTDEPWLWDPFDFVNGVIREYGNLEIAEQTSVTVIAAKMPVRPIVKTNAAAQLTIRKGGEELLTTFLTAGENYFPGLVLTAEDTGVNDKYDFVFSPETNAVISIVFRGGRL